MAEHYEMILRLRNMQTFVTSSDLPQVPWAALQADSDSRTPDLISHFRPTAMSIVCLIGHHFPLGCILRLTFDLLTLGPSPFSKRLCLANTLKRDHDDLQPYHDTPNRQALGDSSLLLCPPSLHPCRSGEDCHV
jgi:hypothetical protein